MTDDYPISRRDSLKGIVTSGALIGSVGFGLGTASASANTGTSIERVDFQQCNSVFVLLTDRDALPTDVRIRIYNADRNRIENAEFTITNDRVRTYTERYDDYYVAEFNVYQFYDRTVESDDRILSVTIGETVLTNPNDCATKFVDRDTDKHDGKHEDKKKGTGKDHKKGENKKKAVDKDHHKKGTDKKKGLDGKSHDSKDKDEKKEKEYTPIDIDGVQLEAVCVDSKNELARFRVDNGDDQAVEVGYDVYGSSRDGTVAVEANSSTYFEVGETASGGTVTIGLFRNGRQVDSKTSNTDHECIPYGRLNLHENCDGDCQDEAEFYVMNFEDGDRSAVVRVDGTLQEGVVTVPNNSSTHFSVDATEGGTTVELFYEGQRIDSETAP